MPRRRVVVTGIGGICSLGNSVPQIWAAMRAGRCGIGTIEGRPIADAKHRIGAEIRELPAHGIEHRRLSTMDRFSLLAVIAAGEAIAQAAILGSVDPGRVGTVVGVGIMGAESLEEGYRDLLVRGRGRYTDDHAPSPALHALMLRSPHAHAKFKIDATQARPTPRVHGGPLRVTASHRGHLRRICGASAGLLSRC